MFEGISTALAAWRTVLHISEWTGLSVGALAGLAALVWFNPRLLRPAIAAAALLAAGYGGLLVGDHTGRTDVEAQWADEREAAIAAEAERDRLVEQNLQARYGPQLEEIANRAKANKEQADAYERKLLAEKAAARPAAKPGRCELGARADRMRKH